MANSYKVQATMTDGSVIDMGNIVVPQNDTSKMSLMDWLNAVYPVGGNERYVQFPNAPTPAERFAGTSWTEDTTMAGRVPIGSGTSEWGTTYTHGAKGGTDKLVARVSAVAAGEVYLQSTYSQDWLSDYKVAPSSSSGSLASRTFPDATVVSGVNTDEVLPPYLVVTYWKRTA